MCSPNSNPCYVCPWSRKLLHLPLGDQPLDSLSTSVKPSWNAIWVIEYSSQILLLSWQISKYLLGINCVLKHKSQHHLRPVQMDKPRCSCVTKIDCCPAHLSRGFRGWRLDRLAFLFCGLAFRAVCHKNTFRSSFILKTPMDVKDQGCRTSLYYGRRVLGNKI